MPMPVSQAAVAGKADPAYGAAGVRLWGDLKRHTDAAERSALIALAIGDATLLDTATRAEMARNGDGVGTLRHAAQGPPAKAGLG